MNETEQIIHCRDCIYFNRFESGMTHLGYCHSNSPVIIQAKGEKKGYFPIVEETCYCGDAEERIK